MKYLLLSFLSFCCLLNAYQHELSVTAIFRDEAPYLREWIEYHKLLGVEHFYLYNNLSQDKCHEVLAPYVKNGEVDLIEWPMAPHSWSEWDGIQIAAYKDALERAKKRTAWLAIIDIDEFLVPIKHKNLKDFLSDYKKQQDIGGVCLGWVFFGTSNVEKIPDDRLLIETLVLNGGPAAGGNASAIWNQGAYKSIVRPTCVSGISSPHYCSYKTGRHHIMAGFEVGQINHYWTRDLYYLENYKIPRREEWGQNSSSVLSWASNMNKENSSGKAILRFIPALKKQMRQ
ncbi:MAG: glycosyltransferase family 92 protein [Parachlamydiaceae bacterium]